MTSPNPTGNKAPASRVSPGSVCEALCDDSHNLIRIRYVGHVAAAEVKVVVERLRALLPQVQKGFTLVTDLSALDSMELDCVPGLTNIMDSCKARGVSTVVRIIPDPHKDIGFNILSIVHYRRGVRVVNCHDAAEAERYIKK
jgi:hypothetical protein